MCVSPPPSTRCYRRWRRWAGCSWARWRRGLFLTWVGRTSLLSRRCRRCLGCSWLSACAMRSTAQSWRDRTERSLFSRGSLRGRVGMAMVTMELPSQPRNPARRARFRQGYATIGQTGHVLHGETLVPDMIVHHVDGLLAERIATLAKLRQCPVNDVLLDALRNGLGMSVAQQYSESLRNPNALTILEG